MTKLNESQIIRIFSSTLDISELDDIALIKAGKQKIAFKCDMLVASTDVPPAMSAGQAARKSIVSCVSDLASKGIRPLAAMVSLGLPQNISTQCIHGLAAGFARASREFRVKISGGDTNTSIELIIDCSMIGLANEKIPTRSGASAGDIVAVSGLFGYPPSGLKILMQKAKSRERFRGSALRSVLEPQPAAKFGYTLARYFSSSMDSSDGLAISLYTIATESKVDILVDSLPSAAGLQEFSERNNLDLEELVMYGGEEYEIACTIPKKQVEAAKRAAKRNHIKFLPIGIVSNGSGKVYYGSKLLEKKGYDHFRK